MMYFRQESVVGKCLFTLFNSFIYKTLLILHENKNG